MNEQEIKELNEAVSKLSEEDQEQIAGGNKITDKQCGELQAHLIHPALVAYGGPGWWDLHPVIDLSKIEPVNPEKPTIPAEPVTKE